MTGTYGTFPTSGPSSTAAGTSSRDTQEDAESTRASVHDQPLLTRVDSHAEGDVVVEQEIGVTRIEALYLVFGSGKGEAPIWLFYLSIGLISYAYSLSSNTVSNFFSFATSAFGKHSILGTVEVAVYVLGAVGACGFLTLDPFSAPFPSQPN